MPLIFAQIGKEYIIKRIGGNESAEKFLKSLGFAAGSTVKLVSSRNGDVIVNIKESRVALNRDMAKKIMI